MIDVNEKYLIVVKRKYFIVYEKKERKDPEDNQKKIILCNPSYHTELLYALKDINKRMQSDALSEGLKTLNEAIKKISEINREFEFLINEKTVLNMKKNEDNFIYEEDLDFNEEEVIEE